MKIFCAKSSPNKFATLLLIPMLLLGAGCHRDQVQVYQVASDDNQTTEPAAAPATNTSNANPAMPPADNSSAQMPGGVVPSDVQNVSPITWTTPAGWTSVPRSEMRAASFTVAGANGAQADISVIPLQGMAGGDFQNVNRWRGQVGLPPASDDKLQSAAQNVQAGGQPAQLYDISGQNSAGGKTERIIAAIQHRDGTTWFFKMTGDADLAEQQKPAFIAFLQTLNFASSQTQGQSPAEQSGVGDMANQQALPPGHPDINGMTAPSTGPVSTAGQPNWQVPSDWQPVAAGQFLVARFMINGANSANAAVNVSSSDGNGGGLAANVNRWRGQLGLAPADEIPTVNFEVPNGQAQLVELSGTNSETGRAAEIVGVMVTQPGQTWFYKLMGDPAVVVAQKDAFTQFVKGVKY